MVSTAQTIQIPKELADQLAQRAEALGMDIPAYLTHLVNGPRARMDGQAADAARFMISKHEASLRKLAQ